MVRPRAMIAVDVTARVWPLRVRTGDMRVGSGEEEGGSAGRMEREKSVLDVSRTREEGKKRREVRVER